MIYDRIQNLYKYLNSPDYELIKRCFLDTLTPEIPDGNYPIDGQRIFANVSSYETKNMSDCKVEAHNYYIDIQCTIKGGEGIDVFERSSLSINEGYSREIDTCFFERNELALIAHINNIEGFFTILFPNEAHSPQQRIFEIDRVKKFVIKYAIEAMNNYN